MDAVDHQPDVTMIQWLMLASLLEGVLQHFDSLSHVDIVQFMCV